MSLPHPQVAASVRLPGAVVLGGAHGSLAVARSLGRRGIPVAFVTHDHPIAGYSRYTGRHIAWPGPEEEGAVGRLLDVAQRENFQGALLIPGGDAEVRLIARHRAQLEAAFRVVTPAWETARWACDKALTYAHAANVGIAAPKSLVPTSKDEVARLDWLFPVILKPRSNANRNAFTAAKAWRVDGLAELVERYEAAAALVGADQVVVQEWIPGGGETQVSYAAVWHEGAPVASLVARRRRQYPIDFGFTSTYVETIEERQVEAAAERFLGSLGFTGLVEVEFKYDARAARYKILDVNPRPWTWIGLGAAAGVDFALIQWRLAQGERVARCRGRAGATWSYVSRDLAVAAKLCAAGALTISGYLASLRWPLVCAAFAWDDPWPGILDLPVVLSRLRKRRGALKAKASSAPVSAELTTKTQRARRPQTQALQSPIE